MISVNQARKILSENFERSQKQILPLAQSLGLFLSEDVFSPIDVPSFDNSAKDGYALKFEANRNIYALKQTIQAGDTGMYQLSSGEAARIFTGAKMPNGADAAIPQEIVEHNFETGKICFPTEKIQSGSNVRRKGSQCKSGDLIAKKGTRITPGIIGLLASVGLAKIPTFSPPIVSYIITGNELKEIGSTLREGEIYNSNGPMLEALLKNLGIKEISALKATDDKESLQQTINSALKTTDVLLISGGISVGDYDFVEECLKNANVKQLFYKLRQRPGKPFFTGKKGKKWVFALPGNPASAFSCFNQFVKPCLQYSIGKNEVWQPDAILKLQNDQQKKEGFTFFLKGKKKNNSIEILSGQQSFNLQAFNAANCLVELEEESDLVKAGTLVKIYDF